MRPAYRATTFNPFLAAAALACVLSAAGLFGCTPRTAGSDDAAASYPKTVSVADAAGRREAGAVILDIRNACEWDEGIIPGSVRIPLGELEDRIGELPTDKDIVVVCHSGARSRIGLEILRKHGLERTVSMNGGLAGWKAAGHAVEDPPREASR